MPQHTEHRDPVEMLGEEFLSRCRRGEQPEIAEYAAAHPDLAAQIRLLFPTMVAMEQFTAAKLPSSGKLIESRLPTLKQLGDFRIIREIGRGGMGIVFEAEQQSLGRHVAVKVFPQQAIGDSRHLKRFRREARTAASLHHTNIVPVFGVGEQDGLHYYVMQRIQGVGLDTVISELALAHSSDARTSDESRFKSSKSLGARSDDIDAAQVAADLLSGGAALRLHESSKPPKSIAVLAGNQPRRNRAYWCNVANIGIQVAEALNYAHAQGVFHRDIKPGNLLLDAHGTVWVTDFGLATVVTQERLSNPGDLVGTLRFMPPEHLNGEHDARSDIYSLGLTLYELLTLKPAFDEVNRAKLVQHLAQGVPNSPRAIRREIPPDLDAVVRKAVSRDPRRRYQSAAELAQDLRRFVEGKPVSSRRIGSVARLGRWAGRNPAIAVLSNLLLVMALVSFWVISSKWHDAVQANHRAEANLSLALDSMDQILNRFTSNWMSHPRAPEAEDREPGDSGIQFHVAVSDYNATVLQDALKFYDQFSHQNATNPRLQRETAKVHQRVGDIYERIGQYGKAERAYQEALRILTSEHAISNPSLVSDRAKTLNQLGLVLYATGRFEDAELQFRSAQQLLSPPALGEDKSAQFELARSYNNLGQALWHRREQRAAADSHRQAIQLLEDLVQQHPADVDYRLALARAYRIYYPFTGFGRSRTSASRIRSAGIEILEELVREFPNVPDYQCELGEMLLTTSPSQRDLASVALRSEQLQEATGLARQLAEDHPLIPRYRALLARTIKSQAGQLEKSNASLANHLYEESVALYRDLAADFADVPSYQMFLAMALQDHAENLCQLGRQVDSRSILEEAIRYQKAYLSLRPENHFGRSTLARQYSVLAKTLEELGARDESEQASEEARKLRQEFGDGERRNSSNRST